MAEEKNIENKKALFVMGWLLCITVLFVWIGLKAEVPVDVTVNVSRESIEIVESFIWDIVPFVLLSCANSKIRVVLASALLAQRGLALGIAACFCAVNAVPMVSVAMIMSFVMISVLLLIYAVVLYRGALERKTVIAVYLIITGAVVILRVLPLVLIK